MKADGTDQQLIAPAGGSEWGTASSWSPDGTRIAYVVATTSGSRIWTVNADGSSPSDVSIGGPEYDAELLPRWSPDGSEIAFTGEVCPREACEGSEIYGIAVVPASGGPHDEVETGWAFDWSPDATYLVQSYLPGDDMYRIRRADGGGQQLIAVGPEIASWSPDGHRIAVDDPLNTGQVIVMDIDGGNPAAIGTGGHPDWQSIPVNAYPRPKGASPTDVPLVPAYEPCTAPNRTHGPPLAFESCNPPAQKPGQLTVGTPDANGQPAKLRANIRINPLRGLPSTPIDEADVRLRATINDVRLRSDLSDYTGNLEVRLAVQITDKDNTPHPGGPGPATVQELIHSHPLPCATTPADTTVGSTCQFDTTVEAVVPGAVKELTRGIWELERIAVHDGAGNLFLTQGIFVP